MKIILKYIGPRVSIELEINGIFTSLYQNVWRTIDIPEKKIIELFAYEYAFEIKPFSFLVRKKIQKIGGKYEFGYDGVTFYKRKMNIKNPIKLPFTLGDFKDVEILDFKKIEKHRPKKDHTKTKTWKRKI